MSFNTYANLWDHLASDPQRAIAAVDGSGDEDTVQTTGRYTAAQLRAALDFQPGDDVFELGCGVGRIARELAGEVGTWHGADISTHMIDVARQRLDPFDNVSFTQLKRSQLEGIADDSFDKAYCVAVLCHMDKEDLLLYLRELRRVLRPGGLCYVETWNLAHPVGWARWELEVNNWGRSDQSQRKDIGRNQFCAPDEFSLYVEHAGLTEAARFIDSPWIQVVAAKAPDVGLLADLRDRLSDSGKRAAYPPAWSDLFDVTMRAKHGAVPPEQILDTLSRWGDCEETRMFARYCASIWRQRDDWGEVPPELDQTARGETA